MQCALQPAWFLAFGLLGSAETCVKSLSVESCGVTKEKTLFQTDWKKRSGAGTKQIQDGVQRVQDAVPESKKGVADVVQATAFQTLHGTSLVELGIGGGSNSSSMVNSSKLDINQKVYIHSSVEAKGRPVLGDGAGEALLGHCTQYGPREAGAAIEVCGTGIKVSIFFGDRCMESPYTMTVGACDTTQPASTCVIKKPWTEKFQSYKIEKC